MIVGANGAGKSTILDALTFVLYNKPFRKIKKAQLINTVNEKECEVQIEFEIQGKIYTIVRGMKPTLFQIYIDGKLQDQFANQLDQQAYLEDNILRLNYKSFTQTTILGSATFVPFMQLSPPNRREVIEDLLDIRIFSTMNTLLRDKVKSVKETLRECEYQVDLAKNKVEMQQNLIANLQEQSNANTSRRKGEIKDLEGEISSTMDAVTKGLGELSSKEKSLEAYGDLDKEQTELLVYQDRFKTKKKSFDKEYKFFDKNDNCPTCHQAITEELKNDKKKVINVSLKELDDASVALQQKLEILLEKIGERQIINNEVKDINDRISSYNKEIQWKKKQIQDIEEKINTGTVVSLKKEKEKLKGIAKDGMKVEESLLDSRKTRDDYDVVSNMLRDTGIKSVIIKKYLPVMNQLVNRYLKELDFYVSFDLNENFEETIKSRFRDEFTYSSFSEGEKMRIDLALLFTWRTIAKMKNSANTNLLILDEIFDSSLDGQGTDDFLKILHTVSDNTNVFVISHKTESLQDKFASTLQVEKKQNFSVISKEE